MSTAKARPAAGGYGKRTWILLGLALAGLIVYLAATARGGVPDPTAASSHLSHSAVIIDSAILVLREGLEAILVLAALTASMRGANAVLRRPVAAGAGVSFLAVIATWFAAIGIANALGGNGLQIQAATGLLAVLVLLVVMNWFFHRVYWTGWMSQHNKRRRSLMSGERSRKVMLGLAALGFSAVYREGFEIVLFLQALRLKYGSGVVLDGVAIGLLFTLGAGVLTFAAHRHLPYKRMLVLTGIMLGFVLIVMVGESAEELQLAGWLPVTHFGVAFPGWVGTWLALTPTVETIAAQVLAGAAVVLSYVFAEELKVRRPRRQGRIPAQRADVIPGEPAPTG